MMKRQKLIIPFLGIVFYSGAMANPAVNMPSPSREFRAAWVATVHNLDWPSRPGLSVPQMKEEAVAILNRIEELRMNAVIFQVRPQADALYRSDLEPWSWYLTGEQGRAPAGGFDPLDFWIEQAHARGIQLHAWFNPYRAYHGRGQGEMAPNYIVKSHPELVVKLRKSGYQWLDPALEEARLHTIRVVMDVVKRYDIDGVHFDDYFYPYPAYNGNRSFPDETSYSAYKKSGGSKAIGDWRRDAVNSLVKDLYREIKAEKNYVEFGISPFGIWRPGYPKGINGLDQYRVLYADARKWIREGWVDYMMPQLYWPVNARKQSFPVLLDWWHEQNNAGRHLWPGMKITASSGELTKQIGIVRDQGGTTPGMCLFSMKRLMRSDRGLKSKVWKEPALIPASPWLARTPPPPPQILYQGGGTSSPYLLIEVGSEPFFQIVVNEKRDGEWLPARIFPCTYVRHPLDPGLEEVAFRAVNRLRVMSRAVVLSTEREIRH